jgi:hypothetical protein
MRHSPRGFSVVFAGEWWDVHCFADRTEAEMFKAVFNGVWCHPEERGAGGNWHDGNLGSRCPSDRASIEMMTCIRALVRAAAN